MRANSFPPVPRLNSGLRGYSAKYVIVILIICVLTPQEIIWLVKSYLFDELTPLSNHRGSLTSEG